MAETEQVQLSIDAVLDGGSIKQLTDTLASGIEKATTEGGKRAQKHYAEFVTAAFEAGVSNVDGAKTTKKFLEKVKIAEGFQAQIAEAWEKGDKEHAKRLERQRKKEITHLNAIASRRKAAFTDLKRMQDSAIDEQVDNYTSKMQSGIGAIFAGDISGLMKGAGKGMQQKGDAAAQKGKMADASKTQKVMGQMGKAMAGIGTSLMAVGAVAGMIMMLVKAFISLDEKIMDMNKNIVGVGTAADFGFGSAHEAAVGFSSTLETIRGDILKSTKDWEGWRQSSESMFQVLGAMNEMNVTFKQMDAAIKDTSNSLNSYADIAIRAVAYGKLMGVTSGQMAGDMSKMMNEFGVGYDVIAEGLHAVHKEAMLSGFSTKRFYSTVLEVTSGLGAYNVRLEEAGQLLGALSSAGGESMGGKAFQQIAGTNSMQGMDVKAALESIITKGGAGAVKDIFADEASSKAALLFEGLDEAQRKAFSEKFGLDASSAQAFGESFAKAAPGQEAVRDTLAGLLRSDQGELMQTGQQAASLGKAGKGQQARMVQSFGDLGAASRMRFMMRLPKMLGGFENVAELMEKGTEAQIDAATQTMGMDRQGLVEFSRIVGPMESQFKDLKKKGGDKAIGEVIKTAQGNFEKTGKGKFQKVELDENDQIVKVLGGSFDSVDGYLDSMNDYIADQTKSIETDLDLAKQQIKATESLNTVLEENVAAILNKIYVTIMDIWHWLSGDASKRKQMKSIRREFQNNISKQQKANDVEMGAARRALGSAKSAPEREAAQARVGKAEKRKGMLDAISKASTTVNPEDYVGNAAGYTDAVYAAARVDKTEFGATGGGANAPTVPAPTRPKGKNDSALNDLKGLLEEAQADRNLMGTPNYDDFSDIREVWEEQVLRGMTGSQYDKQADLLAWVEETWLTNALAAKSEVGIGPLTKDRWNVRPANRAAISKLMASVRTPEMFDWSWSKGGRGASGNPDMQKADDMFVPSGGQPILLNSQDEFLAMKKDGAIAGAMGGGGRGGGAPVTINIRGGNIKEVQQAVIRGIRIAQGEPFA